MLQHYLTVFFSVPDVCLLYEKESTLINSNVIKNNLKGAVGNKGTFSTEVRLEFHLCFVAFLYFSCRFFLPKIVTAVVDKDILTACHFS